MRDYHHYHYTYKEALRYFVQAAGLVGVISYLFYHSYLALLLIVPLYPVYLRIQAGHLGGRLRQSLCEQFKETILSVAAALGAGYSIENAWREAYQELVQMYGEDAPMVQELRYMLEHVSMNVPLEELLYDFAARSGLEDVVSFCQVFFFAKRSGGDFIGMIRSTAERIASKIELQRQLEADLAARRLESRIMNLVPLAILLYLNLSSPGYFDVLYGNLTGVLVMSACLVVYVAAYACAERMLESALEY